jgi:hypothetical protein
MNDAIEIRHAGFSAAKESVTLRRDNDLAAVVDGIGDARQRADASRRRDDWRKRGPIPQTD